MLIFTCEGCNTQPGKVSNIELTPNPQGVGRTTVCLLCSEILQNFPPGDPRVVALINRIEDFKRAWPHKADMNLVAYCAIIQETEPEKAIELVAEWSRRKRVVRANANAR